MKKVILIIIIIVAVVGISYFVTKELNNSGFGNNTKNTTATTNTTTKNKGIENKTNETSNVQKNTVENTTTVTNTENTVENTIVESNTETFENTPQSEESKVISIVKKDWGANNANVKIEVEGINDDGTYIVTVRDSSTTEALAFYRINASNGKIEKKDIM